MTTRMSSAFPPDGCEGTGVGRADNAAHAAHLLGCESCFGKCLRCGGDEVAIRVRERTVEVEDDDGSAARVALLNHGTSSVCHSKCPKRVCSCGVIVGAWGRREA